MCFGSHRAIEIVIANVLSPRCLAVVLACSIIVLCPLGFSSDGLAYCRLLTQKVQSANFIALMGEVAVYRLSVIV